MQKLMLAVFVVIILAVLGGCNTPSAKSETRVTVDNGGYGLSPEMEKGKAEYESWHNAYVMRVVKGGRIDPLEQNLLGKQELAWIYQDADCVLMRQAEAAAEQRAEKPTSFPPGFTPANTTGP